MRFSSAIVLAVVAALASSPISAMPAQAGADLCPNFCKTDEVCQGCMAVPIFLHSASCFCIHIGAVWSLVLTRELLVICRVDRPVDLAFSFDWEMLDLKGASVNHKILFLASV
ncbi:hypothetical protein EV702DRAFT_1074495 [Suillus placidus]|uniref:Uncharacterized protein n=1 Tax=Suillus placidus TaxID=48579 RepID=A0A9P7A2H0_9AGAM|nr:hypothetical protein EV702DRAFT_1074495 [Suillus placidus]